MSALDALVSHISRLPGIGKKSATRIAYYLLERDRQLSTRLAEAISTLHDKVVLCEECGRYTETQPCGVCSDESRDRSLMCVVERAQDAEVIEQSGEFNGLYHVLGGVLSPLDGIGPAELRVSELFERIGRIGIGEVILATNPSVEGDTTALYLVKLLQEKGIDCSRLALGLPVGGDLEYADRLTLARSLRGRTRY